MTLPRPYIPKVPEDDTGKTEASQGASAIVDLLQGRLRIGARLPCQVSRCMTAAQKGNHWIALARTPPHRRINDSEP